MKREPSLKGLTKRRDIWWLQLPMKNGVRPPRISLQTTELNDALARATECRANPALAPVDEITAEMEKHLGYMATRTRYSLATTKAKRNNLLAFIRFLPCGTALADVSTAQAQAFYDAALKRASKATAHKQIMDVRAFFRWAQEVQKTVRRNVIKEVRREPVPDGARVRFCTTEQRDKLINDCSREDLKFVLMMGFHCGLRKQEIIQAVPSWFHLDGRFLDLQPTPTMPFNAHKKPRTVPMRGCVHDFLTAYGLRAPFMLRPEVKPGRNIYRYDFDLPMQLYMKAQGMEWVTAHVMRHTFASLLVIEGKSIFKVARWIGDTVATTEKHYAHLAPRDEDIEEHKFRLGSDIRHG